MVGFCAWGLTYLGRSGGLVLPLGTEQVHAREDDDHPAETCRSGRRAEEHRVTQEVREDRMEACLQEFVYMACLQDKAGHPSRMVVLVVLEVDEPICARHVGTV